MPVDEFGRKIPIPDSHSVHNNTNNSGGGNSSYLDNFEIGSNSSSRRGPGSSSSNRPPPPTLGDLHHSPGQQPQQHPLIPPIPPHHAHHAPPGPPPRRPTHPCYQYVDEPLLCGYVWKEQNPQLAATTAATNTTAAESKAVESTAADVGGEKQETNAMVKQEEDDDADNNQQENKEAVKTTTTLEPYDLYRRKYCLNYIRAFFNHHLDDSWFRNRYSPAAMVRFAEQERNRAIQEAEAFYKQATAAVVDTTSNETTSATGDSIHPFVIGARLGGGQKTSHHTSRPAPVSHLFSWQLSSSTTSGGGGGGASNGNKTCLVLSEIPLHVTDEQLAAALDATGKADIKIYSSTMTTLSTSASPNTPSSAGGGSANPATTSFWRQALVVGPSAVMTRIWKTGNKVPRKNETAADTCLEIEVDCTDPYGRLEYDADGHGGAPADGLAISPKKAVVLVEKLKRDTNTTVLSAALSTSARYATDRRSAQQLANQLDEARLIPNGFRLDDILKKLFKFHDADDDAENDDDVLDVCIAYLRRVHLISFYNGCDQPAKSVVDVLTGKHAASTVHLRLQGADEILESSAAAGTTPFNAVSVDDDDPTNTSTASSPPPKMVKDMLVQRLEASIERALSNSTEMGVLPLEIQTQAAAIAAAEVRVRDVWLKDHSVVDEDQRARCSFHFCHKLFKDTSFLQKHLVKKHSEYMVAEQAKCHDEAMMKAWDAATDRPVPDILVDCGSRFGLVPTPVTGQIPDCRDPEPDLWKRDQERQELHSMQRSRRDEVRQHNYQQSSSNPHHFNAAGSNYNTTSNDVSRPPTSNHFVDVDDMKEEKVELSFDNVVDVVAILASPKGKKKKKRKLL